MLFLTCSVIGGADNELYHVKNEVTSESEEGKFSNLKLLLFGVYIVNLNNRGPLYILIPNKHPILPRTNSSNNKYLNTSFCVFVRSLTLSVRCYRKSYIFNNAICWSLSCAGVATADEMKP